MQLRSPQDEEIISNMWNAPYHLLSELTVSVILELATSNLRSPCELGGPGGAPFQLSIDLCGLREANPRNLNLRHKWLDKLERHYGDIGGVKCCIRLRGPHLTVA
eukprot:1183675-Prorocentrum_minimum.AAC.3